MRCAYLFTLAMVLLFQPTTTVAQGSRATTYVAANGGSDANGCTITQPCGTFSAALGQVSAGGTVHCVDQIGNNAASPEVTITQSVTIDCRAFYSNIDRQNQDNFAIGFIINGAGIDVTLRGLVFNTFTNSVGTVGVDIRQAANVQIEDCAIKGFSAQGVYDHRSTAGNLFVTDTTITKTGNGTGGGIVVSPQGSGSVRATLRRVQLDNNFNGLTIDNTHTSATTRVIVSDSSLSGNSNNGIDLSTSGPVDMTVERSVVSNNLRGIKSLGASATVRIGNSTITGNGAGVQNLGGTMTSLKNNFITGNGQNGTPLAAATDD